MLASYEECMADFAMEKPFDITKLVKAIQKLLKPVE